MSTLESSVTLDDVFSVVEGKRVPLAPELAGYLTLEIADGTEAAGGAVDPRTVFISEEGTVALVRPKTISAGGDAETSVRGILSKLLDASGSATPALTASARRKPGSGLPALVSELEAALIPVNRAAGRRALARLAREVKRVMLGVGRNASMPPVKAAVRPAAPSLRDSAADVMSGPDAPPGPRPSFSDDAQTLRKNPNVQDLATLLAAPDVARPAADAERKPAFVPSAGLTPPPLPGAPVVATGPSVHDAVTSGVPAVTPIPGTAVSASPAVASAVPPTVASAAPAAVASAVPPAVASAAPPAVASAAPPATSGRPGGRLPPPPARAAGGKPLVGPPGAPDRKAEKLFEGDEVDSLLSTFEVSSVGEKTAAGGDRDGRQMRNDLKAIVGLDPTPAPPDATTLAELTKDIGKDLPKSRASDGDGVEALLALVEESAPLPGPPASSRDGDDGRQLPPASVAQPGSPYATRERGPALPETPSPLVPMEPVPAPAPARSPLPPPPAPLKRT
ncbi:MAG: Proline-rich protein, partial [Labilithrix sp.]|nr:Proline-rich protein [Labilithrix sp.]